MQLPARSPVLRASGRARRAAAGTAALLLGACACIEDDVGAAAYVESGGPAVIRPLLRGGERAAMLQRPVPPPAAADPVPALPPAPPAPRKLEPPTAAKVLLHVTAESPARLEVAVATAREIIEHFSSRGVRAEVELVVEAGAARELDRKDSALRSSLAALAGASSGLHLVVCEGGEGASAGPRRPPASIRGSRWLASCGAHVIELRRAGYAYIRP